MEKIIARVKNILLTPLEALTEVKTETINTSDLMKEYVAIIAALPPVAMFIGMIGHTAFFRGLLYCAFVYAIGLASVFVFAKIVDALAPHFNSIKNDTNAFKLAVYAFTPSFVAGIFNINPSLSLLALLGSIYGIYIFYLGLPVLMETPQEKRLAYAAVSILVMLIVSFVLMSIAGAIAWGGLSPYRY